MYALYSILSFRFLVDAGLPSVVKNCSFNNQTLHSVEIQCSAGYDGGLPQVFVLELISSRTGRVRFNMTNADEPYFSIESLDALVFADMAAVGEKLVAGGGGSGQSRTNNIAEVAHHDDRAYKAVIFAVNQKGRSPRIVLKDFVVGDAGPADSGEWFSGC